MGEIAAWVAVAVAAAFGLICALWLLLDALCRRRLCVAVCIPDANAREQLDLLLLEARGRFCGRREIVVLLADELPPLTVDEIALLQRYDARAYEVRLFEKR